VATKPRITGIARVGDRLKATTGTWYGDTPTGYRFRWLACNVHGADCVAVPGATRRTFELGPSDAGERFRALVTAHTDSGSASARSTATAIVTQ
jgi:hypothetical protein